MKYVKGTYGPYAENLRHALGHIEGRLIAGDADGGDAPDKQLSLVPGAIEDARSRLKEHPDALARFERVSSLVDGFETPFGMELLATVHWAATRDNVRGNALVSAVHNWSGRKRNMTPRQIGIAEKQLSAQGWLSAPAT